MIETFALMKTDDSPRHFHFHFRVFSQQLVMTGSVTDSTDKVCQMAESLSNSVRAHPSGVPTAEYRRDRPGFWQSPRPQPDAGPSRGLAPAIAPQ